MTLVGDDSSLLIYAVFITAALVVVGYLWNKQASKKWLPMAPTSLVEVANSLGSSEAPVFVLDLARKMGRNSFRIPLPLGLKGTYVIGDHQLTRRILVDKTTDKPRAVYKSSEEGSFGIPGIFSSTNNEYLRNLRKSTAHAFSKSEVKRMNQIALNYVDEWLDKSLSKIAETGECFDPTEQLLRLSFFVTCEASFEYTPTEKEMQDFTHNTETATREFIMKQAVNPLRKVFRRFIPEVQEAYRVTEINEQFCARILEVYQSNPNKSKQNTLIKLLAQNNLLTHMEKVSNILAFLVAGHGTTAFTLSNIIVLLAEHPHVQSKLRDELVKYPDQKPETIDYLNCVVKECSRILPTAAFTSSRQTGRDFEFQGEIVPKGAICFLPQVLTNYDAQVYEDPDSFRPERWESPTKEMTEAYISPFLVGSRNCPGQALAKAEINSALPRLLSKYELELVDEGKKDFFLTWKYMGAQLKVRKVAS